jgi:N-acetylneuraminic acid mutarotase
MLRPPSLPLVLGLGLLALAACGESDTPTQPATGSTPVSQRLAALTSNTWTLRAPYPDGIGAQRLSAGVVNNASGQPIVYTFGAVDEEDCCPIPIAHYNATTDVWSIPSRDPGVFVYETNGVGQIGGKLYYTGGYDKSGSERHITPATMAYDPASNTLTRKADMPKGGADGISAVIDNLLYVLPGLCLDEEVGGPNCGNPYYRRLLRYNPASDHWVSKKLAPHFHRNGAGGAIAGKFYVAGGFDTLSAPVTALDVYDPTTDTWKTLAPLPVGGMAQGAVIQGKLFVTVWIEDDNSFVMNKAYVYNPATNRWNAKAAPKYPHYAVVLVRLNDKPYLLAVGGAHRNGSVLVGNDNELYTP